MLIPDNISLDAHTELSTLRNWCHTHICSKATLENFYNIKALFESFEELNRYNNLNDLLVKSFYKFTIIHQAAKLGYDKFLDRCLSQCGPEQKKQFLELTTPTGCTPLHIASLYGRVDVVKVLLRHGANANALSNTKQLPIHMATSITTTPVAEKIECIKELFPQTHLSKSSDNPKEHGLFLHKLIQLTDDLELIQIVLEKNHDLLELTDNFGQNPLHIALINNRPTLIDFFLTQDELITETNNKSSILHLACRYSGEKTIKSLLSNIKYQKYLESKDDDFKTPLDYLNERKDIDLHLDCLNKSSAPKL